MGMIIAEPFDEELVNPSFTLAGLPVPEYGFRDVVRDPVLYDRRRRVGRVIRIRIRSIRL